jgi:hypothetical protein
MFLMTGSIVVDKGLAGFQLIKHALENQNPLFTTGRFRANFLLFRH